VWALGVVLYEMLTGRLPFHGDSTAALLYAIVYNPPEPASQLSGRWSAIVDRALIKDPTRRYQDAAELLDAIEGRTDSALAETETMLPAKANAPDLGKPFRRWWAATAAVGALAAAGFGVYFIRGSGPLAGTGPKHLAVLPFVNIGNDPANQVTSDGLLETLTGRLSDLDSSGKTLWVVPASEVRQRKVTEPGDAVKQLGVNFVVTGSVQREVKGSRLTVNLVDPRRQRQIGSAVISKATGLLGSGRWRGCETGTTTSCGRANHRSRPASAGQSCCLRRVHRSDGLPASMGPEGEPGEGHSPF